MKEKFNEFYENYKDKLYDIYLKFNHYQFCHIS